MIISRAPFRVSFCGGGSDIPSFYEKYGWHFLCDVKGYDGDVSRGYEYEQICDERIGTTLTVTVDRPLGSSHPKYPEHIYPLNYGYIEGMTGGDGEEQDEDLDL